MKLSQQSDEGGTQSAECNSPSATREQQELDSLKVVQEHLHVLPNHSVDLNVSMRLLIA